MDGLTDGTELNATEQEMNGTKQNGMKQNRTERAESVTETSQSTCTYKKIASEEVLNIWTVCETLYIRTHGCVVVLQLVKGAFFFLSQGCVSLRSGGQEMCSCIHAKVEVRVKWPVINITLENIQCRFS